MWCGGRIRHSPHLSACPIPHAQQHDPIDTTSITSHRISLAIRSANTVPCDPRPLRILSEAPPHSLIATTDAKAAHTQAAPIHIPPSHPSYNQAPAPAPAPASAGSAQGVRAAFEPGSDRADHRAFRTTHHTLASHRQSGAWLCVTLIQPIYAPGLYCRFSPPTLFASFHAHPFHRIVTSNTSNAVGLCIIPSSPPPFLLPPKAAATMNLNINLDNIKSMVEEA